MLDEMGERIVPHERNRNFLRNASSRGVVLIWKLHYAIMIRVFKFPLRTVMNQGYLLHYDCHWDTRKTNLSLHSLMYCHCKSERAWSIRSRIEFCFSKNNNARLFDETLNNSSLSPEDDAVNNII
uniref:Uncharacterized protein n=1 Tax=Octactis speculum TaxID=3111310 RepID=A0A7S2FLV1_9STRA